MRTHDTTNSSYFVRRRFFSLNQKLLSIQKKTSFFFKTPFSFGIRKVGGDQNFITPSGLSSYVTGKLKDKEF